MRTGVHSGSASHATVTIRLFHSGLTFARGYGPGCHPKPMPFDRTPDWTGPWRAAPPR